jgi:hypothetical protein
MHISVDKFLINRYLINKTLLCLKIRIIFTLNYIESVANVEAIILTKLLIEICSFATIVKQDFPKKKLRKKSEF